MPTANTEDNPVYDSICVGHCVATQNDDEITVTGSGGLAPGWGASFGSFWSFGYWYSGSHGGHNPATSRGPYGPGPGASIGAVLTGFGQAIEDLSAIAGDLFSAISCGTICGDPDWQIAMMPLTPARGIVASNGTVVTGLTSHGVHRAIGDSAKRAGVKPAAVLDALKSPKRVTSGVDHKGRPFQVFYGKNARVVVNPLTGRIVSMNPLSRAGAH